jgi:hypothetical protein
MRPLPGHLGCAARTDAHRPPGHPGLADEDNTLERLHTLCDDGTRAISTHNRTRDRWDITILGALGGLQRGFNPHGQPVEVRCR